MLSPCSPSSHIHSFPPLHDTVSFASLKKPFIPLKRQKGSNYFSCDSCSFAWRLVHNFLRVHSNLPIPHLSRSKTLLQPLWGLQWGTWPQPHRQRWGWCPPPCGSPGGCSPYSSLPMKPCIMEKERGGGKQPWSCWCGMGGCKGVQGKIHGWFLSLIVVDLPTAMRSARDLSPFSEKFREHHNP